MSKKSDLSLDDFKKWMDEQDGATKNLHAESQDLIGVEVASKVSAVKLISKIETEAGDEEELAEEFAEHGGIILEATDKKLFIEVKSGSFYLHRKYVNIKD